MVNCLDHLCVASLTCQLLANLSATRQLESPADWEPDLGDRLLAVKFGHANSGTFVPVFLMGKTSRANVNVRLSD